MNSPPVAGTGVPAASVVAPAAPNARKERPAPDGPAGPGGAIHPRTTGLGAVVVAAFLGPWAVWGSAIVQAQGWTSWRLPQGVALWTLTPALLIALLATGGRPAVTDLARRMLPRRGTGRWAAVAVAVPVALAAAAAGLAAAFGAPSQLGVTLDLPSAATYLGYGIGLFLLTEEAVWRGTLLPRLQRRYSPLMANLALGGIWAIWHLPLLAVPGAGDHGLPAAGFIALIVGTSVLIGAVVNAARGNVLVAAIFHAASDAAYSYCGVIGADHTALWIATGITTTAAAAAIAHTRGRLGLPAPDQHARAWGTDPKGGGT